MILYHIDRTWSDGLAEGTPTQHYADYACYRFGLKTLNRRGPLKASHNECPLDDVVGLILPWKNAQWPRFSAALHLLCERLALSDSKVLIFADDLHHLLWSYPIIKDAGLIGERLAVITNFKDTSSVWPRMAKTFYWPIYPFDRIKVYWGERDYPFGYVGRWNPRRFTILKKAMPVGAVLMGPQWYKQEQFKSITTPLPWVDLGRYYGRLHISLSVQDKKQRAMMPAISRFGEAFACNSHIMIHDSHLGGLPIQPPASMVYSQPEEVVKRFIFLRDVKVEGDYLALQSDQADFIHRLYKEDSEEEIRQWLSR